MDTYKILCLILRSTTMSNAPINGSSPSIRLWRTSSTKCLRKICKLEVQCFYLSWHDKVLYSHSVCARRSKPDDQDNLKEMLQRLSPSHSWKFRKVRGEGDSLLLVHQTENQKRLLSQYGNELCLLDATYKTTRYALPVFFVVIRANTTYQVVGSFVVSEETCEAIGEAARVIKEWNPNWGPSHWMTDCCTAEINALENVFLGRCDLLTHRCILDRHGPQISTFKAWKYANEHHITKSSFQKLLFLCAIFIVCKHGIDGWSTWQTELPRGKCVLWSSTWERPPGANQICQYFTSSSSHRFTANAGCCGTAPLVSMV